MRLEELEPLVVEWAANKGLLANPNPMGQMGKCLEEIQEATEAMPRSGYNAINYDLYDYKHAATELGDVLVTLVIQSAIHGLSLSEVVRCGVASKVPTTWEKIGFFAEQLKAAVAIKRYMNPVGFEECFAGVYCCVADAAQTRLARLPEECLELAWQKIKNRTGETVDGVFVKQEDLDATRSH